MKYTYIEVKSYATQVVEHRIDVSGKTTKRVEAIERGLNINLDTDYYTTVTSYDEPQPLKPEL